MTPDDEALATYDRSIDAADEAAQRFYAYQRDPVTGTGFLLLHRWTGNGLDVTVCPQPTSPLSARAGYETATRLNWDVVREATGLDASSLPAADPAAVHARRARRIAGTQALMRKFQNLAGES
jgi:hypothetical protein